MCRLTLDRSLDDLRDSELYLDGYDMYREDKKPGKGGGILL